MLLIFLLLATNTIVQVFGSSGPESTEKASTPYFIGKDGKSQVLSDFSSRDFLRFEQNKTLIENLKLVLLTHLYIDHVACLCKNN